MRKFVLISLLLAVASPVLAEAPLPDQLKIVAVVNERPITSLAVDERVALIAGTTNVPDVPQAREALRKQVIKNLVDETLQQQEADRYNVVVGSQEMERATALIEKRQNRQPGSLSSFLAAQGLSKESFETQLRTQLAWNKLVIKRFGRKVKISDADVTRARQDALTAAPTEELQITALVFPLKNKEEISSRVELAEQAANALRAGQPIEQVRTSLPAEAEVKLADATWLQRTQVSKPVAAALARMKPGDVTNPLPSPVGIQVVKLLDSRVTRSQASNNSEIALKQIILKLEERAQPQEVEVMMGVARQLRRNPGTCQESGVAGVSDFGGLNIDVSYIRTSFAGLSGEIRPLVENLKVTEVSQPFAAPDGIRLLMLCERIDMPGQLPPSEGVKEKLYQQRMELEAEKYMRDLRREAFIDIRS